MIRILLSGLVLLLSAQLAAAAENGCKDEAVSATGKPSSIGELARANAFFTWKAVVRGKFGDDYMAWSKATERKLVCVDLMSGENKGKWECTRTARPCLGKPAQKTVEEASCQEEATQAYGARRGTVAAAKQQARAGWVAKVGEALGDEWADWERADKSSFDCRRKSKWQYQCIALGIACKN